MSVEMQPFKKKCMHVEISNGRFRTMLGLSGMARVLGVVSFTNDPITATHAQALECYDLLNKWEPPGDWIDGPHAAFLKRLLAQFFLECNGFTTS